jgi:hypothetical protein
MGKTEGRLPYLMTGIAGASFAALLAVSTTGEVVVGDPRFIGSCLLASVIPFAIALALVPAELSNPHKHVLPKVVGVLAAFVLPAAFVVGIALVLFAWNVLVGVSFSVAFVAAFLSVVFVLGPMQDREHAVEVIPGRCQAG